MTNDSTKTFTICEVDKIYEAYHALSSLTSALRGDDGSFGEAGNILKPIAGILADVCDARSERVLSHVTEESESA